MSEKKVFLIIKNINVGGAEKRFLGLWCELVKQNFPIYLVIHPGLLSNLLESKEFGSTILNYKANIIEYPFSFDYYNYKREITQFIKNNTQKNDTIHFIETFPAIFFLNRRMVMSLTASNMNNYNFKGKLGQLIGILLASVVDILDPAIFKFAKHTFFFKKKNIYLTPCSFCDSELYNIEEKKNWIVFLGRFSWVKQVIEYVKCLPVIYKKLQPLKIEGLRFYIIGYGPDETAIREILYSETYQHIPFTIAYEKSPEEILNKSKIFLSLQKFNNYPSKSLIEAQAAGNIPIVTDNGQTRDIAKEQFAYYIPEQFSAEDLAENMIRIFNLTNKEFSYKSRLARDITIENHNITKMAEYFKKLYEN